MAKKDFIAIHRILLKAPNTYAEPGSRFAIEEKEGKRLMNLPTPACYPAPPAKDAGKAKPKTAAQAKADAEAAQADADATDEDLVG